MKKEKDRQELESDKYKQKIEFHTEELHRFKVLLENIKKLLERDEQADKAQLSTLIKYSEKSNKVLIIKHSESRDVYEYDAFFRN